MGREAYGKLLEEVTCELPAESVSQRERAGGGFR